MKNHMTREQVNEENKKAAKLFEDLKPFTITVSNGFDASFLSCALLEYMVGSHELAQEALITMVKDSAADNANDVVNDFFVAAEINKIQYPKFMKPILIMMIDHIVQKAKNEKEQSKAAE